MSTNNNMRHLYLRGKIWWYYRRIPTRVAEVLDRKHRQRYSLKTNILEFAQHKRNLIETSQNEHWGELIVSEVKNEEQRKTIHVELIQLIISDSVKLEFPDGITFAQKIEDLTKRIEVLEAIHFK